MLIELIEGSSKEEFENRLQGMLDKNPDITINHVSFGMHIGRLMVLVIYTP